MRTSAVSPVPGEHGGIRLLLEKYKFSPADNTEMCLQDHCKTGAILTSTNLNSNSNSILVSTLQNIEP